MGDKKERFALFYLLSKVSAFPTETMYLYSCDTCNSIKHSLYIYILRRVQEIRRNTKERTIAL